MGRGWSSKASMVVFQEAIFISSSVQGQEK